MMDQIQNMRQSGISIILVEHDLKVVMGVCDRVAVLNFGLKIVEGTPKEIAKNEQVISAYLGYTER
jgi:branched-chain amino acid transport system ATP-binding protein